MFYSQFILAKKGPLGTIWIAAHLERKLRKNQVADTDIGVSVDSILFPEVPIALRLSSHLLLGVVRIYSRKVNYLFDDCSEALLKIKQAFRSTAVDLPPEESTAPYHSITLPETFDLDDFELPDNDIFQGNYVDHHVSAREQITLQDTMEGVVYATSQFGLDERFGDGDASQIGLDLDEDLLLDKTATLEHEHDGIMDANLQASPLLEGPQRHEEMKTEGIEIVDDMQVEDRGRKIGGLPSATDVSEYPQGPSTPGLEEPNLFGNQVAQVSAEAEYQSSAELQLMKSPENVSMANHGEKDGIDCTLQSNVKHDDNVVCSHHDNNDCLSAGVDSKRGQQEHLAGLAMSMDHENLEANNHSSALLDPTPLVPKCTDGTVSASDITEKVRDVHDGLVMNNEPILAPPDQTVMKCALSGDQVNETLASLSCSHVTSDLEVPTCKLLSNLDGSQGPASDGHLEDDHTSSKRKTAMGVEIASCEGECHPIDGAKVSGAVCPLESCGKHEFVDAEAQTYQLKEVEAMHHVAHEPMPSAGSHLRPCTFHLSQPDVSSIEGEQCRIPHVSDPVVDDHITDEHIDPAVCEEVPPDLRKLDEQLGDQISTDDILESMNSSAVLAVSAPERMLSLACQPDGELNDLLIESTPNDQGISGGSIVGAGVKSTSGKKRTFAESTATVSSVDLVESYAGTQSKRTAEFIPDDDDLLSSILVGRKSSILKLKPTPAAPEIASVKRLRSHSAARTSVSKRKVLMDDTMVLHGDTIRQQLTNTEDIRRIRKKAPCTRREIVMIERQFLEDEIFREPTFTGVSADLILMRSEIFDLTRIKVCSYDLDSSSMDATNDERSYSRIHITEIHGGEMNIGDGVVQGDVDVQPGEIPALSECNPAEVELGTHDIDAHEHADIASHVKELDNSQNAEKKGRNLEGYDAENCSATPVLKSTSLTGSIFGNNNIMVDDLDAQLALMDKPNDVDGSMHTNILEISTSQNVNAVYILGDNVVENEGDNSGVGAVENAEQSVEIRTSVQTEGSEGGTSLYASVLTGSKEIDECGYQTVINGDLPLEDTGNKLGGFNEDPTFASGLQSDDKDSRTGCMFSEDAREDYIHSVAPVLDGKETSPNEEISICQEAGLWSTMHSEISAIESPFVDRNGDNANVADDTEFLNVSDDEIVGDEEDCIQYTEGTDLENSGWSSRTRAVAKYLQTLFDREALHGRKILPLDNILAGKTRKEASRMFFETLVLKTKDYVHVDQSKPFDNINIKPRVKLMKSDF